MTTTHECRFIVNRARMSDRLGAFFLRLLCKDCGRVTDAQRPLTEEAEWLPYVPEARRPFRLQKN